MFAFTPCATQFIVFDSPLQTTQDIYIQPLSGLCLFVALPSLVRQYPLSDAIGDF